MIQQHIAAIRAGYKRRRVRRRLVIGLLAAVGICLCVLQLMKGNTDYPLQTVIRVLQGETIKGATYVIATLRLPRMLVGLLAGMAFSMAGNTFQTMLRNPLASPDIIGISAGSSAAAVFCILMLGLGGSVISIVSLVAGLAVAMLVYALSRRGRFSGGRLILIGIGIQAMLGAFISYMLLTRHLHILELGEEAATTLGLHTNRTRILLIVCAVLLISFATAVTGPIATKLIGSGSSSTAASALVGVVLVLGADLLGQFAFAARYPVGVITGILGAPYLIFLLIRINRKGGAA